MDEVIEPINNSDIDIHERNMAKKLKNPHNTNFKFYISGTMNTGPFG